MFSLRVFVCGYLHVFQHLNSVIAVAANDSFSHSFDLADVAVVGVYVAVCLRNYH